MSVSVNGNWWQSFTTHCLYGLVDYSEVELHQQHRLGVQIISTVIDYPRSPAGDLLPGMIEERKVLSF